MDVSLHFILASFTEAPGIYGVNYFIMNHGSLMKQDLLFQIMKSKRPRVMEKLLFRLKRRIIMGHP